MEKRIVTNYERGLTTTVNDIEHIESQSLTGISVIKIFFQPGAKIEAAIAQVTAISQTAVRQMPPGTTPPFIIRYSASNVPILQLALESDSLSEQQLFDYGTNFIRADIATIQGAQIPWPYGGKQRQIMIDIDPQRLYAWGLSPRDVNSALGAQNVILPDRHGEDRRRRVPRRPQREPRGCSSRSAAIPIKIVNGTTVYVRDVANVRDGYAPQTNIVHVEGKKSVLMSILKNGSASTLDVVARIRDDAPDARSRGCPKELKVTLLFDQSVFVRAAVEGVVKEAAIAAGLTALMILLFLGSWRSTLIVVVSIPLSILVSIIVLGVAGPDAQRHDARRHGARRRHPRRRRDRRDREHPPQPGAAEAARPRHPRRRRRRSRRRRSSRRSASASSSCRSSSSPARRSRSSSRWRWPSSSRC